jgi:hypothetical protein
MVALRNAYNVLVRKPIWKRTLRRHRRRWKDNIRMYLTEIGWEVLYWMHHLAQDRVQWLALVNTVMNLRVP